jgi:hypothetical protein
LIPTSIFLLLVLQFFPSSFSLFTESLQIRH